MPLNQYNDKLRTLQQLFKNGVFDNAKTALSELELIYRDLKDYEKERIKAPVHLAYTNNESANIQDITTALPLRLVLSAKTVELKNIVCKNLDVILDSTDATIHSITHSELDLSLHGNTETIEIRDTRVNSISTEDITIKKSFRVSKVSTNSLSSTIGKTSTETYFEFYKLTCEDDWKIHFQEPFRTIDFEECNFKSGLEISGTGAGSNLDISKIEFINTECRHGINFRNLSIKGSIKLKHTTIIAGSEINFISTASRVLFISKVFIDRSSSPGTIEEEPDHLTINSSRFSVLDLEGLDDEFKMDISHSQDTSFLENLKITRSSFASLSLSGKFPYLVFNQDVSLREIIIKRGSIIEGRVKISSDDSNSPMKWTSRNVKFESTFEINGANLLTFNSQESTYCDRTRFISCTFKTAPRFESVNPYQDTRFYGCDFQDETKESEVAYSTLKSIARTTDDSESEINFAALEQRSRLNRLLEETFSKRFFTKLPELGLSLIYYMTNYYGKKIALPFIWIFIQVFLYAAAYSSFAGLKTFDELEKYKWINTIINESAFSKEICMPFIMSLIHSGGPLKYLTDIGDIVYATNLCGWLIGLIQSIMTTILWYLGIVGIRRHFKTVGK